MHPHSPIRRAEVNVTQFRTQRFLQQLYVIKLAVQLLSQILIIAPLELVFTMLTVSAVLPFWSLGEMGSWDRPRFHSPLA